MTFDEASRGPVSEPGVDVDQLELRLGEVDRDGALADGLEGCGFTRVDLLHTRPSARGCSPGRC